MESYQEIEKEFEEAFQELKDSFADSVIDLSSITALDQVNHEHCELLFSLGMDEISGVSLPEFNELIKFSEGKEIDAAVVQRYLRETEKRVERQLSPQTLHEMVSENTQKKRKRVNTKTAPYRFTAPSVISLLAAFSIDLAYVFTISSSIAGWSESREYSGFFVNLLSGKTPSETLMPFVSAAIAFFPLVGCIYWTACFIIFEASLGGRLAGLKVIGMNGKKANLAHSIVRGMLTPLFLCIGGHLPVILGYRTLSDVLARTVLVRVIKGKAATIR